MNILSNKKFIIGAVVAGFLLVVGLILLGVFSGTYNRVVTLEENINTSQSNISKEEQRRADLFNNMVDAVESARNFEQDTLVKIAEARGLANSGKIEQAQLTLAAVVEAYPEIKTTALYDKTMTEFAVTENRVAGYREQYNTDVRSYNRETRGFPNNAILGIMGYETGRYEYLDYDVPAEAHRDLFNK